MKTKQGEWAKVEEELLKGDALYFVNSKQGRLTLSSSDIDQALKERNLINTALSELLEEKDKEIKYLRERLLYYEDPLLVAELPEWKVIDEARTALLGVQLDHHHGPCSLCLGAYNSHSQSCVFQKALSSIKSLRGKEESRE